MLHASELSVELPTSEKVPCLSLCQPTHHHYPDNQQDPIRCRNLEVRELRIADRFGAEPPTHRDSCVVCNETSPN